MCAVVRWFGCELDGFLIGFVRIEGIEGMMLRVGVWYNWVTVMLV